MLIDRILDSKLQMNKDTLRTAEVMLADNVSDYFYQGTDQDYWNILRDFPNCAPPFEKVFIEWGSPALISTEKGSIAPAKDLVDIRRFGCEINSSEIKPDNVPFPKTRDMENIRWVSESTTFIEFRSPLEIAPSIGYTWYVKADGSIWLPSDSEENDPNPKTITWPVHTENMNLAKRLTDNPALGQQMASHYLYVALLTLCFLNCKNIRLETHNPSEKQNKSRVRKGKIPLLRYHVLDIGPMKTILETEGDSKSVGLKKALHICRGHFKDFSHGKGLFGKNKGFYWWDAQVRGNSKQGFIDKDYRILTDK